MTFIQKIKNEINEKRISGSNSSSFFDAQGKTIEVEITPLHGDNSHALENEINEKRIRNDDLSSTFDADALNEKRISGSKSSPLNEIQQYISDVFLTSANGSIKNGYVIDFAFDDSDNARNFCDILAAYDILPKLTQRGDSIIVYIKSREDICNLLALVDASKALYELNNEIVLRDLRSSANRRANCDSGNIAKQVATAREQVEAISKLDLTELDSKLRKVAEARLDNPNASYEELAEMLGVSKSCLVHRMRKLLT